MLGFGLGLRHTHFDYVISEKPPIDWFEIISENFMNVGGRKRRILHQVRKDYSVVMHGVSLSIGSVDPISKDYLKSLKELMTEIEPAWVSDHLCWGSYEGSNAHDLLPLPYTEECLNHLTDRIHLVQDTLKRPFVIENVSSYLTYKSSEMTEWEFIKQLTHRTGCRLLVDINNIYVSSYNHQFDPMEFLRNIPRESVQQFHLAGHKNKGAYLNDTHDEPVCEEVWQLYKKACEMFGPTPTMIERDGNIPEFSELYEEFLKIKSIQESVLNVSRTQKTPRAVLGETPNWL